MKKCHVCGAECENDAEICQECGAELSTFEQYEREQAEKEAAQKSVIATPVLAVSVDNVVTAEIYKDVLSENEIPFFCDERGEGMQVAFGGSFFAVDIYVDEGSLERAQELYDEVLESESEFEGFFEDEEAEV